MTQKEKYKEWHRLEVEKLQNDLNKRRQKESPILVGKICPKCLMHKMAREFYIYVKNDTYSLHSPCKKCVNQQTAKRAKNSRESILLSKYNINSNDYSAMLKAQNNKCAICNIDQTKVKRNFAIDHCHKSNRIRALLCGNCNSMLGLAKDNIGILKSAIGYLQKYSQVKLTDIQTNI